jgi:hypothetical protein
MAPRLAGNERSPRPARPRTVTFGGRYKNDMRMAKRGKRLHTTQLQIAEFDGARRPVGRHAGPPRPLFGRRAPR